MRVRSFVYFIKRDHIVLSFLHSGHIFSMSSIMVSLLVFFVQLWWHFSQLWSIRTSISFFILFSSIDRKTLYIGKGREHSNRSTGFNFSGYISYKYRLWILNKHSHESIDWSMSLGRLKPRSLPSLIFDRSILSHVGHRVNLVL